MAKLSLRGFFSDNFQAVCSLCNTFTLRCSLYYKKGENYLLKTAQQRGIIHTEQEKRTNRKNKNKRKIKTITKGDKQYVGADHTRGYIL